MVLPDAKDMQQSATINVPADSHRVTIATSLPEFLYDRQYSLWTLLERQPLKAHPHAPPDQGTRQVRVFDAVLHPGLNTIETHLIAAIPRGERVPGGPEVELEVFTIYVNVMRS